MIRLFPLFALPLAVMAQDPYRVAGDHYHLLFENDWVRATRVTFSPHDSLPVHSHPATPTTLYVNTTDGGPIAFHHITGANVAGVSVTRKPVLAGALRFAHGAPETHTVDYLGDAPSEYARIELRTEPIDRPMRDVRLPPFPLDLSKATVETQFENGQVRIIRVGCPAAKPCPSRHIRPIPRSSSLYPVRTAATSPGLRLRCKVLSNSSAWN